MRLSTIRKPITILAVLFLLFFSPTQNIYAQELLPEGTYEKDSVETIPTQKDLIAIFSEMNSLSPGETSVINGKWLLSCTEFIPMQPASAYSTSKSFVHAFNVTILGTKKVAFSITQYVSYIINSETNTVRVTSYHTSFSNNLSGLSFTHSEPDFYPSEAILFAVCHTRYDISSIYTGNISYAFSVSITSTGACNFSYAPLQ